MINRRPTNSNLDKAVESGQVAIVTVAMFMMIFTALVVSFSRIMVSSSHESSSDNLHASSKTAAESGVEDAKRILAYCYSKRISVGNYGGATGCNAIMDKYDGQQTCSSIIASGALRSLRAKDAAAPEFTFNKKESGETSVAIGQPKSGTTDEYNEYYTCIKIATRTLDYEDTLGGEENASRVIKLKFVDASGNLKDAAKIKLQWHDTASSGDHPVKGLLAGKSLPSRTSWLTGSANGVSDPNRPAAVRFELAYVPSSSFTIDQLKNTDRAVTLRPSSDGNDSHIKAGSLNIDDFVANDSPNTMTTPIMSTKCTEGIAKAYSCEQDIVPSGSVFSTASRDYYLRLMAIYRSTNYRITAYDSSGKQLYFDGTQPLVDVTGNSGDAFDRVTARLLPQDDDYPRAQVWFPDYAIDTNGNVCKNITSSYDDGTDSCI